MRARADNILGGIIRFLHETLGLSPNAVSILGFAVGIAAAALVGAGALLSGMLLLALSQLLDGLDGGIARRYNLFTPLGRKLELACDRVNELAIFLALAYAGEASFPMAILAFVAILLVTITEPLSGIDPGFKRFTLYFGYAASLLFGVRGFEGALHVVFIANLAGAAVGMIVVEYRLQQAIDAQALLRREREVECGIPPLADDPPSFLSKIFS